MDCAAEETRTRARVISGVELAKEIMAQAKADTEALGRQLRVKPHLAVVIVGDDPASEIYVNEKIRAATSCGIRSSRLCLDAATDTEALLELIDRLNRDPQIHGILVQLPLPRGIERNLIISAIDPLKDVDGFHPYNVGMLNSDHGGEFHVPCTPAGCMLLIKAALGADIAGKHAVVIGRSNIVGKPMLALLGAAEATVVSAHIKTKNISELCRSADIIVVAAGSPGLVRGDWIKPGAVVIDVGINRVPSVDGDAHRRIVGDVHFEECREVAGAITPVPGGVGPMTIAMLMANTVRAARRSV